MASGVLLPELVKCRLNLYDDVIAGLSCIKASAVRQLSPVSPPNSQEQNSMATDDTHTPEQIHRGSFAEGQANPDLYPDDLQVGSFAKGDAKPDAYPEDTHLGTFAEGEAQPLAYPGEDHQGTFAETAGRAVE